MATFKAVVLKHHKKGDGTYNVKIRVTHNQNKRFLPTSIFVCAADMTKSLKIKNQKILDDLDAMIKHYRTACNENPNIENLTVEQVVEFIKAKKQDKVFTLDFLKFAEQKSSELYSKGRGGNARLYKTAVGSLKRFIHKETLDISEITVKFLNDYVVWLDNQPTANNHKKGNRAKSLYPTIIRTIHNLAKNEYNNEDFGVINIPQSPFAKFKVPKMPITKKRALSINNIQAIINLQYQKEISNYNVSRFNFAKDVFLLSFGLIGMNSVDLYNCTELEDGVITYNRTKTKSRRSDRAEMKIKIQPEIMNLVEKYQDETSERIFKFYKLYSSAGTFNAAINKGLKQIGKLINIDDLEFYAARHSWATIALNIAGIDKYTVHTALNHVDSQMKVTDIYIDKDYSQIDEANAKVLELFNFD